MKTILKYLFIVTCSLASVVSCERFDEQEVLEQEVPGQDSKVKMTFTAQIEGDTDTRTILGGQMGDEYRKVLWQPNDSIGVTNSLKSSYMDKFVNIEEEVSEMSTFDGKTAYSQTYYMFYPYSKDLQSRDGNKIDFVIPTGQTYAKESFASNAMPMVAKGDPYSTIQFYSLCGVLALNITGSETVQSISFTGKNAEGKPISIAGNYYVDMDYEDTPKIYTRDNNNSATVTLNCGDGVALDASTPTPFYIVLPPATYDSFTIMIATTDGKIMIKQSTRPLTIKRVNVTKTGALTYVANETIDLSTLGTANSYIVSEAGLYSINATTIGNGEFGFIDGESFHTSESTIDPVSAHLVWEDTPGVIGGVTFSNGRINFMSTGTEGNALVAATDADGKILWSWHIWVTDKPEEQTYVNTSGSFIVQDRNLGATRADRGTGDEWKESCGLDYQWGRKDPFAGGFLQEINQHYSIEDFIHNPTVRSSSWDRSESMWRTDMKTIYDPCPVGYRVASNDIWTDFSTSNTSGSFEKGWYFYINDNSETAWYPNRARASEYGTDYWGDAYMISSTYNGGIYYSSGSVHNNTNSQGNLRCMKDENATSMSVKIQSVSDVTATSAKVTATVASQGNIAVARAGIVCGTSSSVTLDNGTVVETDVTSGKFMVTVANLESLNKYYVKSFSVASDGKTYYSNKTLSFITPSEDGVTDLSVGGTANSYIVYPVKGTYVFDLVKGNSSESVGDVSSMEVLWETYNNASVVKAGSVVSSATLENGKAKIEVPKNVVSGNALIAAKAANGTILWSWHIWVADYDPEQTQQTYATGAIMMDRNLGAISVKPGTVESYGFFYQWGRKDPFVVPGYMVTSPVNAIVYEYYKSSQDTIEHATQHPTTVYDDACWNHRDSLWIAGNVKTIYDPCPAGWKVSDKNAWGGNIIRANNSPNGCFQIAAEYATPTAYIPLPGYSEGNNKIVSNASEGHIWLAERGYMRYFISYHTNPSYKSGYSVDHLMGVRCMKMEDGGKPGSGSDVEVDDDYEWE